MAYLIVLASKSERNKVMIDNGTARKIEQVAPKMRV